MHKRILYLVSPVQIEALRSTRCSQICEICYKQSNHKRERFMSRITIKQLGHSGATPVHYTTTEHIQARMSELNVAYSTEIKQLNKVLMVAQKRSHASASIRKDQGDQI